MAIVVQNEHVAAHEWCVCQPASSFDVGSARKPDHHGFCHSLSENGISQCCCNRLVSPTWYDADCRLRSHEITELELNTATLFGKDNTDEGIKNIKRLFSITSTVIAIKFIQDARSPYQKTPYTSLDAQDTNAQPEEHPVWQSVAFRKYSNWVNPRSAVDGRD